MSDGPVVGDAIRAAGADRGVTLRGFLTDEPVQRDDRLTIDNCVVDGPVLRATRHGRLMTHLYSRSSARG